MSKHTPGPWKIERVGRHKRGHHIVAEGVGKAGRVGYSYSNVRSMHVGEEEANAHLISAAPDLLEACKALLEGAELVEREHGVLVRGISDARAAISKAEGGVK